MFRFVDMIEKRHMHFQNKIVCCQHSLLWQKVLSCIYYQILILQNLIVMGQQVSNHQLITQTSRSKSQQKKQKKEFEKPSLRHEGILKISQTPFQNCQKIETNHQVYFLEQTRTSLKDLIKHKIRLKKGFSEQQVTKFIENLVYTLAYLQSVRASYPFLSIDNIFLCKDNFKVVPPEALKNEIYGTLKQCLKQKLREYVPASPEMIIAVRCQQHQLKQQQILLKSNVFALGLILLQICTLKPSAQCYDLQNYDILDQVITERIQEIQGAYSNKIARIIANMIDYDFQERMTPKELSIWVNRQFNEPEEEDLIIEDENKLQKNTERYIAKSRLVLQIQKSKQDKEPFDPPPTGKTRESKVSERRMKQIRAKINKQKVVAQIQACEQRDLSKSRGKCKKVIPNQTKDKNNRKNLPNPYLNHDYHNKSIQRNDKRNYSPSPYKKRQLGVQDIERLRAYPTYQQNVKYQYSRVCKEQGPTVSQKQINLKYKYKVDDDQQQQDRAAISSNRKKDTDRFMRVQNLITDYQRSYSGKKYNYNVMEENYEERELKKQRQKEREGLSSQRKRTDKQFQYRNYQKERQSISDFTFEPIRETKANNRTVKQPFGIRQNFQQAKDQGPTKQRPYKQPQREPQYQRHQRLYTNQSKSTKNTHKENEDILIIKKQIQRSRRIIQEVKKTECQSNYYD